MNNKILTEAMNANFNNIYSQYVIAVSRELSSVIANWPGKEGKKKKEKNEHPKNIQMKIFMSILEGINWRQENSKNIVMINMACLASRLGWAAGYEERKFAYYIKEEIVKLMRNSIITIKKVDENFELGNRYFTDYLFLKAEVNHKYAAIMINPAFLPYLKGFAKTGVSFITYWSKDLASFKSEYATWLYVGLKNTVRSNGSIFEADFTTLQLKSELFGLDEKEYTRVNKDGEVSFRRTDWEHRTLDRGIEEINEKSQYIKILPQIDEKGKTVFYTKNYVKKKGKKTVDKYHFKFELNNDLLLKERFFTNFPKSLEENCEFDTNKYFSKEISEYDFSDKTVELKSLLSKNTSPDNNNFYELPANNQDLPFGENFENESNGAFSDYVYYNLEHYSNFFDG